MQLRLEGNRTGVLAGRGRGLFLVLAFCALWILSPPGRADARRAPEAVKGVLDLRGWDLRSDGPVGLSGEWAFFWNRLVGPEDLDSPGLLEQTHHIRLPATWDGISVEGMELTGTGFGTYHLEVLLNNPGELLGFRFLTVGTAFSLYVNGRKITSAGTVGTTPRTSDPEWCPHVAGFRLEGDRLSILMQVSNFHHRKGGVGTDIRLGLAKDMTALRERSLAAELFLAGSIFLMGLYHLGLYLLRRKHRAPLHFGLFCLLIAAYTLLSGERFFVHVFPASSWALRVKLTNLASFLSAPLFLIFLCSLFPRECRKGILQPLLVALFALSGAVLVTPPIFFTRLIPVYHVLTLLGALYSLFVLIAAVRRNREGAAVFLIGFSFFFLTIVNDVLYDHTLVRTGQFIGLGLFLFIFAQSFLLSMRFSTAFGLIESQRGELREAVTDREREIRERKLAQQALGESEEKYRLLAENATDVIWTLDLETMRFTYISPSIKRIRGFTPDEAMALPLDKTLTARSLEDVTSVLAQELARETEEGVDPKRSKTLEVQQVCRDGSLAWAEVTVSFLRDGAGRPIGLMGVTRDIRERKEAERLYQAKIAAEAASRTKSEFLATMSHELRTPLNHIIGFTELVADKKVGDLNELQEEYLRDALKSSGHLLSLINDILDLSKVEAGRMQLQTSDVNLHDLLEGSLGMLRDRALKHGVTLRTDLKGIPEIIRADERKLKQVLYNLLSNAVKFTPDGGDVVLKARCVDGKDLKTQDETLSSDLPISQKYLYVTVIDTGIGIKPKDMHRLFRPFEQIDGSVSRRYEGTGLGLALTRSLVELHGGKVWAESAGEGKGSTFRVALPIPGRDGGV